MLQHPSGVFANSINQHPPLLTVLMLGEPLEKLANIRR